METLSHLDQNEASICIVEFELSSLFHLLYNVIICIQFRSYYPFTFQSQSESVSLRNNSHTPSSESLDT